MSEPIKCAVCDAEPALISWTDTHGVAQCVRCGTPYRIYHYENDKRVEKPPDVELTDDGIARRRRYWQAHQRPMPSGCSLAYGDEPHSQEIATRADAEAYAAFYEKDTARP